jgi:hypothetical protein
MAVTEGPFVSLPALPEKPSTLFRPAPPDLPPLPTHPGQALIEQGGMPAGGMPKPPERAWQAVMPQGGMPQLPKTWSAKSNPSAHVVQNQYVDTRLEEIEANRLPHRKLALDILERMLLAKFPPHQRPNKIPFKELWRIYKVIQWNLQSADLTVNFNCETWFKSPNPYDTYTQMYQRAVEDGKMVLRDTEMNQADVRANADNAVTFPKNWSGGQSPLQQGSRGELRGGGLRPGLQSQDRIRRQMDTGKLVAIHNPDRELPAFLAGNQHFNPDTKQVFLALNYGRRPHGSAINYGYSYFVAKHELKPRCFYYAQDTFMRAKNGVDAGAIQVPYDNLGALLEANGDEHLRKAIFASCYEGQILEDQIKTLQKFFLVEAHHFGELAFSKHVDYMVISPNGLSDRNRWPTIVDNARAFCQRNGVKLFQTD